MNADQIKANDQTTVSKLVSAGHHVQYGWSIDRKGRWSVYLQVWHRNDTKRLDPRQIGLDALFHNAASAKAYAILMRKGAVA